MRDLFDAPPRPPTLRASFLRDDELIVDNFAGGGGASSGIEAALGRPIDIAINHSPAAIAVHAANHPRTRHLLTDVWEVDPVAACAGRPVGLAWFSPDCTHFSRAKGGKPRSKKVRSLAWVVVRWAKAVRPRVVVMENVEEFEGWGPLRADGTPDPARAGRTFRAFVAKLRALGYAVEWRSLVAADYGAPTIRRRLFLVARCDGAPIAWPAPSHARAPRVGQAPWRAAAECIDWSIPCPSIFERRRPLAEATLRRIVAGIVRYVINSPAPYIVPLCHTTSGTRVHSAAEPLRTITTAKGGEFALVTPFVAPVTHPRDARVHALTDPLRTVTAANRGELALIAPSLVQIGYGERAGQAPRALDLHRPLGTVVATGNKHALVAALLTKHFGGVVGHELTRPAGAVTGRDHHALTVAHLTKFYGTSIGADVRAPMPTVTGGGQHIAAVRALLIKYYGADGSPASAQPVSAPLHTATTRARFGLVTVAGEDYAITDIGMRMLEPEELKRAQAFAHGYVIAPALAGRPLSKTAQIELIGNSVCPPVAEAIVRANLRGRDRAEAA